MATQSEATGAPFPLTINGHALKMSPLRGRDFGELDNWLRARVIQAARASLTEEMTEKDRDKTMRLAMQAASRMTWTSAQGAAMLGTPEGIVQFIWQGVHRNHPEVTTEDLMTWILEDPGAIAEAMDSFEAAQQSLVKKKVRPSDLLERTSRKARKKVDRKRLSRKRKK